MCERLEREHIKDVIEYPRGHYKTTIHSEGNSLWRALPFTIQDEEAFLKLGYSDKFIRFMQLMHNPFIRILLVTNTDSNARILGSLISKHVMSNAMYRMLFPETLPTKQDTWNARSLQMRLPISKGQSSDRGIHGEGTFDFLGVGNALQSRHYHMIVEDDLVGKAAIEQQATMDKVIDYHKLLPGAFDKDEAGKENDELIIGNRWSFQDLNAHIKEQEPEFSFETHSAIGGCCDMHLADRIIFPERFNFTELDRIKRRFGNYYFSCQYLNSPISAEDADFKECFLNYFTLGEDQDKKRIIKTEVKNGEIKKDIYCRTLRIVIAVDPNHSGNAGHGRSRHAIVCLGMEGSGVSANYYLLEYFAERCSYEKFYANLYRMAEKWRVREVGFEIIAAQKYCAYALQLLNKSATWPLKVKELKGEVEGPDGILSRKKEWRVRSMLAPIFERGSFYVQRSQQDFLSEYLSFPKSKTWDLLDALAYCPNLLDKVVDANTMSEWYKANQRLVQNINKPISVNSKIAWLPSGSVQIPNKVHVQKYG